MTIEDAISRMKTMEIDARRSAGLFISLAGRHIELEMAIEALKEVKQYRALGTVEELKEAKEKQTPKKPVEGDDTEFRMSGTYYCSSCGFEVDGDRCCSNCGQAIDWSEE